MPTQARYYSSTAAKTTLAASISSSATSLTLAAASNLPAQYPYTFILEKDTANEEVVEVTSLVGSAYQITRNIDSSGAKAHSFGANVEHGVSARDFTESRQHEVATTGVHGITGDAVGTGGAQTLTSKTLTAPIINAATISGAFTSTATITGGTITGATITGLATPTNTSDAATKGYIDTQTVSAAASATSASVSASSASTSASSAATSASSSLTSQGSASVSASSAATSASSAATSASTMAASVTSAQTSATSAATSASSALTSQTSAATSASSAATSASSALTSATSAAASATTAAASVATIATYATTASNSASAAATSAASAATSASSAATSASSALTSATSAAISASSSATSATSAAASATTASNSSALATTSASSAATSATNAATSASSASTSASSAASSATNAATSYDDFDDRYLGSKASAPTLDNDGNTLLVGAIYWNSTLNNMYVWSGSVWVQIATTSVYTAPTLGSTTIASGTTYSTIAGLTLTSATVTLTADPSVALAAATKQYVDNISAGMNAHDSVDAATTAAVVGTYTAGTTGADGGTGVGAFFTVTATGTFVVDGYTTVLNDRVLLKNQTVATQNGIYKVTVAGTTGVSAVLTRATDYDNSIAGEVFAGDVVFVVNGSINSNYGYVMNAVGTSTTPAKGIKIGTDNINWTQFAGLVYAAPTLGSTSIVSGSTNTTLVGFTKLRSAAFTQLDGNGFEVDLTLMSIMGAY